MLNFFQKFYGLGSLSGSMYGTSFPMVSPSLIAIAFLTLSRVFW